jgi:hypothetical protein
VFCAMLPESSLKTVGNSKKDGMPCFNPCENRSRCPDLALLAVASYRSCSRQLANTLVCRPDCLSLQYRTKVVPVFLCIRNSAMYTSDLVIHGKVIVRFVFCSLIKPFASVPFSHHRLLGTDFPSCLQHLSI